jgi:hypothetical protein
VLAVTAEVVIVKDGDTNAPPATVTEVGTVALGLPLVNVTTAPPNGAGPFRLMVPVTGRPPRIATGDKVTVEATSGATVRMAGTVTPL